MISEKNDDYGVERGFGLTIEDNKLTAKHAGRSVTAATYIPEATWMSVYMYFDMDNEDIYVYINNVLILMDTKKTIRSSYNRNNSIVGIDFFNKTDSSLFQVDDICVTEYVPGYDDPMQAITHSVETVDMR